MVDYQVDLTGKVAVITGGSRGLGKAMSIGLAEAGARVVVSSRKLESCEAVVDQIQRSGGTALAVSADNVDIASLDGLLDETYAAFGKLDILINNAGTDIGFMPLDQVSVEKMDFMYQTNLRGPWYLASRAAPRMGQHGGGSIINVISTGGLKPSGYLGAYGATKSGLHALTKVMAQEWAPLNIKVNSVAPGSHHSDLFDRVMETVEGFEEGATQTTVMKRIAATEEILGPVLYLCSDASSFTTGACMVCDGGFLLT